MQNNPELLNLSKAEDWLQFRMPEIQRILGSISETKPEVVGDDMANLNRFHTVASTVRERQQYVKTYLVNVINMQLEAKRFSSLALQSYKDAMGEAFTKYSELISGARSFEEKELRLRKLIPEIKEKEGWDEIKEQLESLKEAVQLVYDDLSKSAMAVSLQMNVVRNQILTGELKVKIAGFNGKEIITENLFSASDKQALKVLPGDGSPSGEFRI